MTSFKTQDPRPPSLGTGGLSAFPLSPPLPVSGSQTFCGKCGSPRVDVRMPCCGRSFHARYVGMDVLIDVDKIVLLVRM